MTDTREPQSAPITCQWCRNSPATQVFVYYFQRIKRRADLVCASCGDSGQRDAHRGDLVWWRFHLVPIKEKADA